VDGGGVSPLMLEYTGMREGEEEEEEEEAEEIASSLGSARRLLLLEDGDFISDAERAASPDTFAVTRASLEARKKRGAGAGAGAEMEQLGLAPPPPGAAPAAAPVVPPSPGWKRENAGQRERVETPRRGSLSVDYGEASGGGVLALRKERASDECGDEGDEERAPPPLHGEYLKMIIEMSASRDVQDAVGDPEDFQVIAAARAFLLYDADWNGTLARDEFKDLMDNHSMVSGSVHKKGVVDKMFDKADLNRDGQIDFNEFVLLRERLQLKREMKTAKSLWSVGTEKAAERVTAAADALANAEEAEGPTSIVQIAFRPKWIDKAKRMQADAEERAEELKKHALLQLEESLSAFDAVDAIDDHDLSLLTALCGGAAALLTVDDALDYTRALGLRLGRLFSGDDVRDAVETLLKIQKYELDRGPADPSNPTVSAGELVEHLKERRHAKQQRADKIRHMQGLSPATDSPERRALSASAPVDADREALAREATSSSCEASSTVAGTTIG
jgi:hypothetical protein